MNAALFAGLAFALFGAYLLKHALTSHRKARESLEWPGVHGQLTDVRLWGKRNIGGQMVDAEKLDVEYQYEVDGRKYTGRTPAFYTLMYPETLNFAERHSAGGDVEVRYNPEEPTESVLLPGPRKDKPYSDLILGCLGVATGVVIAVLALAS